MRLIKLKNDHYIIVADSEIKEDDWYYWEITKTIQIAKLDSLNRLPKNSDGSKKITHSTQPLEDVGLGKYDLRFNKIFALDLDEIKELIGEKSWKGYIDGTEWEVEIVDGKFKLK